MHRREFNLASGALLSTAAFCAACGGAYVRERGVPPKTVPADEEPIVSALRYGISAPSAHNTQPWRFRLLSAEEALLYTDPTRVLPWTDPPRRQIHISHGTLLEAISVAAPALGRHAEIQLLPEGDVAPSEYGKKPNARIRLVAAPEARPDPLFDALGIRRSSRLEHAGAPPSEGERSAIVNAARAVAGVQAELRTRDLDPLLQLAVRAMAIEVAGDETYGESRDWFRFSRQEVLAHGDGLNLQTSGADSLLARLFFNRENFMSDTNRRRFLDSFDQTLSTTQALLVLETRDNTLLDWLATGRAYLRGQLAAARAGLRFHPVSQALQEFSAMDEVRAELERLLPVQAPGKVQMLVRVGRTEEPALSPRRALDAMLV